MVWLVPILEADTVSTEHSWRWLDITYSTGNLVGEMGMGVDNTLSLRVVLANGAIVTASATSHPDLFWAMCGAGPNFGIVVSMTVNAMPASPAESSVYIGNLFFSGDKIEQVAQAVQELELSREQRVFST